MACHSGQRDISPFRSHTPAVCPRHRSRTARESAGPAGGQQVEVRNESRYPVGGGEDVCHHQDVVRQRFAVPYLAVVDGPVPSSGSDPLGGVPITGRGEGFLASRASLLLDGGGVLRNTRFGFPARSLRGSSNLLRRAGPQLSAAAPISDVDCWRLIGGGGVVRYTRLVRPIVSLRGSNLWGRASCSGSRSCAMLCVWVSGVVREVVGIRRGGDQNGSESCFRQENVLFQNSDPLVRWCPSPNLVSNLFEKKKVHYHARVDPQSLGRGRQKSISPEGSGFQKSTTVSSHGFSRPGPPPALWRGMQTGNTLVKQVDPRSLTEAEIDRSVP